MITADDLKQMIPMQTLVESYGIPVRSNGMCSCPFHGADKHPSMKIYKDGYNCFTCGANGDIFSFVMQMENCDFKTAYLRLGGEYANKKDLTFAERQKIELAKKQAQKKREAKLHKESREQETLHAIKYFRRLSETLEPFSDDWCQVQNDLAVLNGWLESRLDGGMEVETDGIISRYRKSIKDRNNIG